MIINANVMRSLYVGYSATFQGALSAVEPTYKRVAMDVPSTTKVEEYGWLGKWPKIREWIGERVINNMAVNAFQVRNRKFESTVEVDIDDIEDDNIGMYTPMFSELGAATAAFPDELTWPLLKAGFTGLCYDGRPFFDASHPVLMADGVTLGTVSNTGGGSGTPWFLLDTTRAVKPLIYQKRRDFQLRRMDAATDEVVFRTGKAQYGVDGRCNAAFGLWQLAYGSKQTLDSTAYGSARAAMTGMLGDYERPLGIKPTLLVVPPALEAAARQILTAEQISGSTNLWRGTAELLVVPWLA